MTFLRVPIFLHVPAPGRCLGADDGTNRVDPRPDGDTLARLLARAAYAAEGDAALLGRWLDHRDRDALWVLVDRHAGVVARACRAAADDAAAADAFQQAFVRLVEREHTLRRRGAVAAWLARAGRNAAKNLRRGEARHRAHAMASAADPPPDPDPAEELAAVRAAVAALPDHERLPLELVYLDGLTHAAAATRMGVPVGTLSARVSRGLARLRAKLGAGAAALLAAAGVGVPAAWVDAAVRAAARAAPRPTGLAWWIAAAAGLAACGAAGFALTAAPQPEPVAPPAAAVPAPEPESLPARNKRVLETEVLPKVVAALKPLALNGGDVTVTKLETHDFRANFFVDIRPPAPAPAPRLRLTLDTRSGAVVVFGKLCEENEFTMIDPARPITLAAVPQLGLRWTARSEPLHGAVAALKAFPPDPRAGPAAARHAAELRAALAPYRGVWWYRGDPRNRTAFATTLPAGPDDPVELADPSGHRWTRPAWGLVVEPDGRVRQWFDDHPFTLADAGRRLDRTGTGHWWVREGAGP